MGQLGSFPGGIQEATEPVLGSGGGGSGTIIGPLSGAVTTPTAASGVTTYNQTVPVNKGGTGATTAAGARTALGLVIGTSVQAYSANLDGSTVAGGAVLQAANATAQTALFNVATSSLKGLMSAADKTMFDNMPILIQKGAFSGSSLTSTSWAAGKYRRLEIHIRLTTGTTGDQKFDFGLSAASNYTVAAVNQTLGVWTQKNQLTAPDFLFNVGTSFPAQLDIDAQISTDGGYRTFTGFAVDGGANMTVLNGVSIDTTTDITRFVMTFVGATTGYIEIWGTQ